MNIDEMVLRAYVDSELPRDQREQVEVALAHNDELNAQVQALRASVLPYRAAFETQTLPPLPESVTRQVAAWSAVAGASSPTAPSNVSRLEPKATRRSWLGAGAALAASFAAGMIVPMAWRRGDAAPTTAAAPGWIDYVAKYQAMYVRDTLDQTFDDPVRTRAALAAFVTSARAAPASVAVPDLRDAGLTFRRVQRLGFRDKPLLQMVYLPAEGKPAALCVLRDSGDDTPLELRRLEGLAIASWRRQGLGYVFAADMPSAQAAVIAEKLTAQQFPALHLPAG
jgi:anti-sigma factor RsiW